MAESIKAHQYKDFVILQARQDIVLGGQSVPRGYASCTNILELVDW